MSTLAEPPAEAPSPRPAPRAAAGVTAAVIVASAAVSIWLAVHAQFPSYDGAHYLDIARRLVLSGELSASNFPPGWPALIAAAMLVLGPSAPTSPLHAAQLMNVLAGALAAVLAYAVARRWCGGWGAAGVAAAVALLPLHLQLSAGDLSELSYQCALLASLLVWSRGRWFSTGALGAAAYLARPEALLVVPAQLVVALRQSRGAAVRLAAGWGLGVVPYAAFLTLRTGRLTVSGKLGFLEQAVAAHPGLGFAHNYALNARELAGHAVGLLGWPLVALCVLGLVARRARWQALLLPMFAYPAFSFQMGARYLVPYVPMLVLGALDGAQWIAERIGRLWTTRRWHALPRARATFAMALVASFAVAALDDARVLTPPGERFPTMRDAGLWLRTRVGREQIVADRKPYVAFWAGCTFRRVPDGVPLAQVLYWMDQQHVDYLAVHVGVAAGMTPALLPLTEGIPAEAGGRLRLAHVSSLPDHPDETVFLYERLAPGLR